MRHAPATADLPAQSLHALLPDPAPTDHARRLLLYVIRRMGGHGLKDAHAANALLGSFGMSAQRPLVLIRALVLELARAATRRIAIAGCCCGRMTADEAAIIATIAAAPHDAQGAHAALSLLLGTPDSLGALVTAQAVAQAFADLGRPLDPVPWSVD